MPVRCALNLLAAFQAQRRYSSCACSRLPVAFTSALARARRSRSASDLRAASREKSARAPSATADPRSATNPRPCDSKRKRFQLVTTASPATKRKTLSRRSLRSSAATRVGSSPSGIGEGGGGGERNQRVCVSRAKARKAAMSEGLLLKSKESTATKKT